MVQEVIVVGKRFALIELAGDEFAVAVEKPPVVIDGVETARHGIVVDQDHSQKENERDSVVGAQHTEAGGNPIFQQGHDG
jgi:hypothetical protein